MKSYYKNLDTDKLTKLKKVELDGLQKINLNLTDDARELVQMLNSVSEDLLANTKLLQGYLEEYDDLNQKALRVINELEDDVKQASSLQDDANALYRSLENSADALGISVSDIPVADELDKAGVDIDDFIFPADDTIDEANQTFA